MRRASVAFVVVVLVAAGCGSADDEAAPAGEAEPGAPEAVEAEPEAPEAVDAEPGALEVVEAEPGAPEGAAPEVQAFAGDDGQVELPTDADVVAEGVDDTGSSPDAEWVVLGVLPAEVSLAASGGEIAVSWSAADAVEGSPIAGYEVQWRSGDQGWDAVRRVVVVGLSYVVGGLDDGVEYSVRVRPAAVEVATAQGASIAAGAGSEPTAEIVVDAPVLDSDVYESVSALPGAVSFEVAGEPVWPATIEIPVDVDRLGDEAPVLVYFNEAFGAWVPASGAVFDRDRGVVVAEVYHLSLWIVVFVKGVILVSDAATDFVGEWWDDSTNWLRAGWSSAQKFLLRDIPALAGAVLDKLDDVGAVIARGAREVLEAARDLSAKALEFLVALFQSIFSLDIDRPVCSGPWPDWVDRIELEGRANNALYWCAEDDGSGKLKLKLTVNRGYSMVLEDESNLFGPLSSENITVIGSDVPEQLSDLMTQRLYDFFDPTHIVFLPSGSTTTFLVPSGALRGYGWISLGYYAEQIAWLMDIFVALLEALLARTPSLSRTLADEGPTIIDCAWLLLSANRNASWFDKIVVVTENCILPSLPHLTKKTVIDGFATAASGFVLLYNGARMLIDGTITPGNRVFIDRDPTVTTTTTTTAPPTTTTAPPTTTTAPPTTTTAPPTTTEPPTAVAAFELNSALEGGGIIATGGFRNCGLRPDQTIVCWGGWDGASGYTENVPPTGTFTVISVGIHHACGVRTDQTVACWGGPSIYGELNAPEGRFLSVSVGAIHACGVRTDNTIACWGEEGIVGILDVPVGTFISVSVSNIHVCGVRTDQTITCWGYEVIPGTNVRLLDAPTGTFIAVSVSVSTSFFSCGLRTDQTITCWGDNQLGQLDAPTGRFLAVSSYSSNPCGLRVDQTITCWGSGSRFLQNIPEGKFLAVSARGHTACGLKSDQTVTCWGPFSVSFSVPESPEGRFGPG